MKIRMSAAALAALLPLAGSAAEPEQVVLCLNDTGLPAGLRLPTRQLLEGKTVKVFYYLEESQYPNPQTEAEPVVQTFEGDTITESAGSEKYTDKIWWKPDAWCRKDTSSGTTKCYALTAIRLKASEPYRVHHTELTPDAFCKGNVLGVVEGVTIPAELLPAPRGGTRRGG